LHRLAPASASTGFASALTLCRLRKMAPAHFIGRCDLRCDPRELLGRQPRHIAEGMKKRISRGRAPPRKERE
jgi:hypothetical protein